MSRDIRSYFAPVASSHKKSDTLVSKPQKRHIISSDEDDEKPRSTKRTKIMQKSRKVAILSDSDDDVNVVEIKKNSKQSKANKSAESKPYKISTPGELFGKKPVIRIEEKSVNQKLRKMESEFHDDDDFDAVLKQLDASHDIVACDTKKRKSYIQDTKPDILKNPELVLETEENSNKNKQIKYSASSEDDHNGKDKKGKRKGNETRRSQNKDDAHSKINSTSPLKRKLHEEKKSNSGSNDNLDKSDKLIDNTSRKLNIKKLKNDSTSVSVSKDENIEKQSPKNTKTIDLFEERIKKKKERAIAYEKYLHRGGARNPGSKEVPTGAKNCLAGVSFLITGVLDSLERNEAEDLIRNYGGRIVNVVSGKVNYIIVGDEAGPKKLIKANNLGIKQISEDDLLEMIRTRPEGKSENVKPAVTKAKPNARKTLNKSNSSKSPSPNKIKISSNLEMKAKTPPQSPIKTKTSSPVLKQIADTSSNISQEIITKMETQPLVERYRPKTMKQIIGQQGDRSCANNLYIWLRDWYKNRQDPKFKDGTGKQTNGQSFKAVLLSGPPGVGKTTTAQVVCKELGYDFVEFNASDTRNKSLLKEEVSGLLSNTTMKGYFTGIKQKITNKHVVLMDEVDGMAGNEDRGGLQELVNLIKHTDVPIICICNDRFNTKVKTISCHSYDLRFSKLRVEQIRSSMKSLCYKEKIKISTEDLDRLIESTNHDIRQVINHLEFLGCKTVHVENTNKKHCNKDVKLSPFDVVKRVFNAQEQKSMSLNDKIGLYFHDYNIAPLFVQENYAAVKLSQMSIPQRLQRVSQAADSISQGDLIEKVMRSNMMWSLLPLHACLSFVIPGSTMSGSHDLLPRFPTWFGRNSKTLRFSRLMQELTMHTRLTTGVSKDALNMDYLVHIRNAIIKPLIDNGANGIEEAVNVMGKYHLMREDLDSMIEISTWPGVPDLMNRLDSKVKAAFTRAYQKNPPMLPYAVNGSSATKRKTVQDENLIEEDDEEDDDINSDRMIKAKKPNAPTKAPAPTKRNSAPAKKRGRGRGKTK